MKPFPDPLERAFNYNYIYIYNYRLSRGRRIIENIFGLLVTVFRVFRKPIPLQPKKVESVVLACISLHNSLRRDAQSLRMYTPPGTFDSENLDTGIITPGSWRLENEGGLHNLQCISKKCFSGSKKKNQKIIYKIFYFRRRESTVAR